MLPTFKKAVEVTLSNWPALQFAVQQQAGGAESAAIAEWMVGVTEQYFYDNQDLEAEEVAEYLTTIMDQELNTMVEDESDTEIGSCLCRYYQLCVAGSDAQVLSELAKIPTGNKVPARFQDLSEEGNNDEAAKPPQLVDQLGAMQLAETSNGAEPQQLTSKQQQDKVDRWLMVPRQTEPQQPTEEQQQDMADGWTMVQRRKHK
ncbi:pre-rRNA-processing protein TSR2 homolog [Eriocheir sinensis]|uniref:pre-rRNA-processing protein TSR2 homolog n=1 Tax=Eriocheir sinensis TaxID=95602 RepID=UPI0021CADBB9|nr:pre-rRNA-processing protein TSR2 homolog [Eriocheir sinensis]